MGFGRELSSSSVGTQPACEPHSARSSAKQTVLVVDDSASICELVRQTLTSIGYEVITAVSGDAAIKLAEQYEGEIHLLLTDLSLPRIAGYRIAEAVTTARPNIKVMFMSGHPQDDERVSQTKKLGSVFLQKPFGIEVLRSRVRELLSPPPGT